MASPCSRVTPDLADSLGLKQVGGAIVSSSTPGSAAERAGMKRGDVIESFNGQPVHDTNSLRNRVAEAGRDRRPTVVVLRDGSEKHAQGEARRSGAGKVAPLRRQRAGGDDDKAALGVAVAPLTPELARTRTGARKTRRALLVQDVNPEGRAADAGIQPGDVIQEVNRQPVTSIDDLRAALKVRRSADAAAGEPRRQHAVRDGQAVLANC